MSQVLTSTAADERNDSARMIGKRLFDMAVSLYWLMALSPILLAAALAVKLSSRGPILYRQERMGRNFRPFKICKFRTMVVDADRVGAQITAGRDPRITKIGAILRKTKIDELPQLWNVLVGEMSFVGPRPEVRKYVELFRQDYETLLTVRPGITDLASVEFRDEAEILGRSENPEQEYVRNILPRKIELGREYCRDISFGRDLSIIWRTLCKVAR